MKSLIGYAKKLIAQRRIECLSELEKEEGRQNGRLSSAVDKLRYEVSRQKRDKVERLDISVESAQIREAAKGKLAKAKKDVTKAKKYLKAGEERVANGASLATVNLPDMQYIVRDAERDVKFRERQMTKEGAKAYVEECREEQEQAEKEKNVELREMVEKCKGWHKNAKAALKVVEDELNKLDADLRTVPQTMEELMSLFKAQEEYIESIKLAD